MLSEKLERTLLVTGCIGILGIIVFSSKLGVGGPFSSIGELLGLSSTVSAVGFVVSSLLFLGSASVVGRDLAAREESGPE